MDVYLYNIVTDFSFEYELFSVSRLLFFFFSVILFVKDSLDSGQNIRGPRLMCP